MPVDLSRAIIGGATSSCSSYLVNPLYCAVLIVVIIFLILVWVYWKTCKVSSHITTAFYIFGVILIILIAYTESIKNIYEEKYRNHEADDVIKSIIEGDKDKLLNNLSASIPVAYPIQQPGQTLPLSSTGISPAPVGTQTQNFQVQQL